MALTRRSILKGSAAAAGGLTILVGGGLVYRGIQRGAFESPSGIAYEAWDEWREAGVEGPLRLVQAGILAANAHNTQPWIFQVRDDQIAVYADRARHLGPFDPYRREMTISIGCALQNIFLAAGPAGQRLTARMEPGALRPSPPDAPRLLAVLGLAGMSTRPSPLSQVIGDRHTNRGPYLRGQGIPSDLQEHFQALVEAAGFRLFFFTEGPRRQLFDEVMLEATDEIGRDPAMMEASHHWFRATHDEIAAHRDGPALDSLGLPEFQKIMARILPAPDAAGAHAYWRRQTEEVHLASAPLVGAICVPSLYDQLAALEVGRLWQHMHLMAVAEGFAMHPMNQPAEVVDRQRQLGREPRMAARLAQLTEAPAWKPSFLFRMGLADWQPPPSPRRALSAVIAE